MNVQPVSNEDASATRDSIILSMGIAIAVGILIFAVFSWMDTRKVPTITFHATPDAQIAVDVRGAVSTPGVVYLAPGARMVDVINNSGGLAQDADPSLVNLSSRVADGQMIVIPTQAPVGESSSMTGLININTASVDELKQLPGIGDVLAQRIVTYREFNGPFQSINELGDVEGISPSLIESLTPYVTVSGND